MEAVIISQTYRTEAHVDSDPDIHHNDIAKKFILAYHNVTDKRNFALANIKKAISPKTIIRMAVFTRYVNLLILEASMSIPPKPY